MRAVIFDWGGVLMRTLDHTPRHAWDHRLGLPPGAIEQAVHGSEAWRRAQRGEISERAFWAEVGRALRIDPELLPDLRYDFSRGDVLDRDLIELIRELRRRRILVGLMSNNIPALRTEIEALRIDYLFDAVVISSDIGILKPDPRAFHAVLDRLHTSAQDAIFIDDFIENVMGARRVGLEAIHFTPGIDLRRELHTWFRL
ncbi:MAG: hypothetical protein Kow00124_03310 [Anaerolineae bacterium]